jgi:hypothetical protein
MFMVPARLVVGNTMVFDASSRFGFVLRCSSGPELVQLKPQNCYKPICNTSGYCPPGIDILCIIGWLTSGTGTDGAQIGTGASGYWPPGVLRGCWCTTCTQTPSPAYVRTGPRAVLFVDAAVFNQTGPIVSFPAAVIGGDVLQPMGRLDDPGDEGNDWPCPGRSVRTFHNLILVFRTFR